MSILVTGASGFLGSHLVEKLAANGQSIVAISLNPTEEQLTADSNIRWVKMDLLRDDLDLSVLSEIESVFHLAAVKEISSVENECVFLDSNEKITLKLIHAFANLPVKVIFASSQMVYGDPGSKTVNEDFPLLGMNTSAYACSKLNAENWMRFMQLRYGGSFISLRFCGFIEGGGNIDYIIDHALRNEPIELYSKGVVCRDYLSASDGIEAFLLALSYQMDSGYEVFNIGSGNVVSTSEIAKLICDTLESNSKIILSDRKSPRSDFVYDISRAVDKLGFVPKDLRASIKEYALERKKIKNQYE